MPKRRTGKPKNDDSAMEDQKKKKMVQTKLDIHFSFHRSTSGGANDVVVVDEKDGPSTSNKQEKRENLAGAALMRATKISASKDDGLVSSYESLTIDLAESPAIDQAESSRSDVDNRENSGTNNTSTSSKRFWENDDEESEYESCGDDEKSLEFGDEDEMKPTFLGAQIDSLRKLPLPLGKLTACKNKHTILFDTSTLESVINGQPPRPYPRKYFDRWDGDHVRMPCSSQSEYPASETELVPRWTLVQTALTRQWTSFNDLKEAILSYNDRYASRWGFGGLEKYVERLEDAERDALFSTTIPKMAELALQLPELLTQPIPLLKHGMHHTITMTQHQAACLLANAFFCTYPRRNQRRVGAEYSNYPEINFNGMFGVGKILRAKLDFIFHYFRRVTAKMPDGVVSYERISMDRFPDWARSEAPFTKLHISRKGTIEDFGEGMLQIDFANKFLGGGVLHYGAVQEEIRFLICPELIVPMLFTEALADNECFIMTGCERFSYYTGYSDSLQWLQSYDDTSQRDSWGRRRVEVVAIDAFPYRRMGDQFKKEEIDRELNKAYCGFARPGVSVDYLSSVATGNWGCGAFGGDKDLKSLIQLMAASEAGRDVAYFTFDDDSLMTKIHETHEFLVSKKLTVGVIYEKLIQYCNYVKQASPVKKKPVRLLDFIRTNDLV